MQNVSGNCFVVIYLQEMKRILCLLGPKRTETQFAIVIKRAQESMYRNKSKEKQNIEKQRKNDNN